MKGHFIYNGLIISQHPLIKTYFEKLLQETKPKRILEIGTAYGGLTLLIRDILDELKLFDTQIRTYDILESTDLKSKKRNIEVIHQNIFTYPYDELIDESVVRNFISQDGTTIVLCDGGSKKNEFKLLSKFLKKGDIIMAHDYAPNQEYFDNHIKGKIWNWLEIQDFDINECCERYHLKPFMEEEFRSVVWVGKIKQ